MGISQEFALLQRPWDAIQRFDSEKKHGQTHFVGGTLSLEHGGWMGKELHKRQGDYARGRETMREAGRPIKQLLSWGLGSGEGVESEKAGQTDGNYTSVIWRNFGSLFLGAT